MSDLPAPAAEAEQATHYLGLYRRMTLIRGFEDRVQSLFLKGHIHGTTHLCSGQEAVEVGVASMLRPDDRVGGTYRGHGHALALGLEPQKLMDELLGRATGVCGGRAGSMNVVDLEHGLIGCFGIVGGSIAAATGAALALRDTGNVGVAFFGDGAINQAYFYECLNFAKVFSLPALYVCENNMYGEYTRSEDVTAGTAVGRVEALQIPATVVDGNDLWAVRDAAAAALEGVRRGDGPAFIEALTYRFVGHSRSDPGKYRPEGELDRWRERDPLVVARARLIDDGVAPEELDAVEADVLAELDAVEEAALAAPFPDPAQPARVRPVRRGGVVHVVGKLSETAADAGPFAGRAEGLTRRPLFDRMRGTVHHSLVHFELAPEGRLDRHMHAFEQAIYVLSGSLAVDVAGEREELAADDYLWLELGVPHALATGSGTPAAWLEASAPNPGASLEDTVFTDGPGATPDLPYRRGHFDLADLPEPSSAILAGAGTNVGGASVRLLVNPDFGASQLILMALQYVPGGAIKEHDHAFEEGFFFVEGEIEAVLDGETYTLGAGDYFWSGVESMHALSNRSDAPVRWLETQAPQPPSNHQFRYRGDWEMLAGASP